MEKEVTLKCGKCGFKYLWPENKNCPSCGNSSEWGLEQLEEEHEQRRGVEKLKERRAVQKAINEWGEAVSAPLPEAIAAYAEKKASSFWLFIEKHIEAQEANKRCGSCQIVKEAEGALQAIADIFGLPALKAALNQRGLTCPIVTQQTSERLIGIY